MEKVIQSKGYTPLKMRGAYIGLIVPAVFIYLIGLGIQRLLNETKIEGFFSYPWSIFGLPWTITLLILGFLIGWGIHSFIRLKKK
jgi:hypothetical protein